MKTAAKILITGGNGQVGSEFRDLQSFYPDYTFILLSRAQLDITDNEAVYSALQKFQPQYVVNCAAYTAVDKAEADREAAMLINSTAVGNLAGLCKLNQCKFIHISTDYVFDGNATKPLTENDAVRPVNYYGETKWRGEQLTAKCNPDALIIRSSWVYSHHGSNFVKTMIKLMHERNVISVVNDQIGSPTYAADLAGAILQVVRSEKWIPGSYHFSNTGTVSWYEFAVEIKRLINSSCVVSAITTDQYPTLAKRPAYSVLDTTKIQRTYGIQPEDWRRSLKKCIGKVRRT